MRKNNVLANIYLPTETGKAVAICRLEYYEENETDFFYVFSPYWDVIDRLPPHRFYGIQGIDLSLRKEKYIRKNVVPTFITERAPIKSRENLSSLLQDTGMTQYVPLQWLKLTSLKYFGDPLFVGE